MSEADYPAWGLTDEQRLCVYEFNLEYCDQFFNIYCYFPDNKTEDRWNRVQTNVVAFLFLALVVFFIRRVSQRIKQVQAPNPSIPWNQTYCWISLQILELVLIYLVLNCIQLCLFIIVANLRGERFRKFFFSKLQSDDQWELAKKWPNITFQLLFVTQLVLKTLIYYFQWYEQWVMRNMILFQKNKSVQQIAGDVDTGTRPESNSEIDERLFGLGNTMSMMTNRSPKSSFMTKKKIMARQDQQMTFRQQEKRLFWRVNIGLGILTLFDLTTWVSQQAVAEGKVLILLIHFFVAWGLFFFEVWTFISLRNLMKKFHNFEFQRTKKSFTLMFILYIIVQSASVLKIASPLIALSLDGPQMKRIDNSGFTDKCICPQFIDPVEHPHLVNWVKVINFFLFQVEFYYQIFNIALVFILVEVKSTDDILQGISKLDYLMKVSYFQKLRDTEAERDKWTLFLGQYHTFKQEDSSSEEEDNPPTFAKPQEHSPKLSK